MFCDCEGKIASLKSDFNELWDALYLQGIIPHKKTNYPPENLRKDIDLIAEHLGNDEECEKIEDELIKANEKLEKVKVKK